MTNYEAIRKMTPAQMADFLDQVYLTGLHQGMHAERSKDGSRLDDDPFDILWLADDAEKATQYVTTEDGDLFLLNALVEAIFQSAGIEHPQEME